MTNEKLTAIDIVKKYYSIVSGVKPNFINIFNVIGNTKIPFTGSYMIMAKNCAIEEVKACIRSNPHSNPFTTHPIFSTMEYYEAILSELEKM